jgi:hypothetical protein
MDHNVIQHPHLTNELVAFFFGRDFHYNLRIFFVLNPPIVILPLKLDPSKMRFFKVIVNL